MQVPRPPDATEPLRDCSASTPVDSPAGARCVAFIGGFLEGVIATDARVAHRVVEEIAAAETFAERALGTRIDRDLAQFGPSVYAGFCLG